LNETLPYIAGSCARSSGDRFVSGFVDPRAKIGYFGTGRPARPPGHAPAAARISRAWLRSNLTLADDLTLGRTESALNSDVVVQGFLYTAHDPPMPSPGFVVKIDLARFARVAVVVFGAARLEMRCRGIIYDRSGAVYVSLEPPPGTPTKLVKVLLSSFSFAAVLNFSAGMRLPRGMFMDRVSNSSLYVACAASLTGTSVVVEVDLATFALRSALTFAPAEINAHEATLTDDGTALIGMNLAPGRIVVLDGLTPIERLTTTTTPATTTTTTTTSSCPLDDSTGVAGDHNDEQRSHSHFDDKYHVAFDHGLRCRDDDAESLS